MIRALVLLLALLTAAPSLSGCSAYQAYVQRQAIQQARFNFKGVALNGFDLGGANLAVVLELENPTDTQIVLDRLDYTLYVNGMRVLAGFTDARVTVPAHDVRPIAFTSYVRFADAQAQVRGILAQGVRSYGLEGIGHFDTPFGTVDYPIKLMGQ